MSKTAKLLTQAEYARHRKDRGLPGASREAVRKAVASERISAFGPDQLIDPALADQQWARNTRQRVDQAAQEGELWPDEQPQPPAAPTPPPANADAGQGTTGFHEVRTQSMSVKLRREQLALAEQEGLLLERAQAERDLFNIFRELRDRHDVIARRIAPELATTASTEACEIVLQRAYQRLLTETIAALAISVLGQETATRLELVPTYQ